MAALTELAGPSIVNNNALLYKFILTVNTRFFAKVFFASSWLSLCEQSHEAPCQRDPAKPRGWMPASQSHTFRLIDVRKECVVSRPWQSRYLALSYVWGGIEQLRLERHSIDALKVPRSLQKLRDDIPKTIQDAITFVYLIGEKYLWVDVLCLVQDDKNSMKEGIQLMNFVYENALATIVAADGSNPHAGLRRLHSNSTYPSTNCVQTMKPGLRLMALGALDLYLKKLKWSSRSWTFQEQLLSRRTVVFVNKQVYFCCRQRIWSEDTCTDKFPDDRLMYEWRVNAISCLAVGFSSNGDLEDDEEPLTLLTNMLEYYGMRELTYERDAINAISGVLNVISTNMGSEFLQGIPVVALDYMVLFQIYGDKKITRDKTPNAGRRARRRRNFPSWSWAGWEALYSWNTHPDVSPTDPTYFNQWLDHRTWIVWYKSIGSDLPKAILKKQPGDKRSRGEIRVCYSRTSQPSLADRFVMLDTLPTVPAASFAIAPAYSTQDLLRFYTVVVILTVSLDIPDRIPWPLHNEYDSNMLHMSDVKPTAAIYDSEGCFSGLLLFDIAGFVGEDGEYELVLLSDSQNSLFNRVDLPDPSRLNPFVSYQAINSDWRLYWVLLLTWNEGVAERRGLGQILRSAVEKSFSPGPQWREIVLG
ncbi:hypothetical protein GJ744_006117 [Endocarpon pusillum]|uniref:Heterokaryon incompatibility domain-containing protein n=1 Tax=Endocarpon pusillum TaxID=364733 RepID=A0A8H7APC0_9EURO|nr:hypothetical protein GJ744_006117 [Endocarpon pusillum]